MAQREDLIAEVDKALARVGDQVTGVVDVFESDETGEISFVIDGVLTVAQLRAALRAVESYPNPPPKIAA